MGMEQAVVEAVGIGPAEGEAIMLTRLILTGMIAAALASAQRGGNIPGGMGGDDMGLGGRGGGVDSSRMAVSRPSRFEQISQMLKLNKEQRKQFRSIMDEAQKEATPVHEQMLKSRLAIGEALQAGKGQDELNPLVASEAALEARLGHIELSAFARIYQTLDKDQQAQTRQFFQMMKGIFNGKNWNSEE